MIYSGVNILFFIIISVTNNNYFKNCLWLENKLTISLYRKRNPTNKNIISYAIKEYKNY